MRACLLHPVILRDRDFKCRVILSGACSPLRGEQAESKDRYN